MSDPAVYNDHRRAAEAERRLKARGPPRLADSGVGAQRRRRRARRSSRRSCCPSSRSGLAVLEDELKLALVEADPADAKDVIVEVRQGVGGDEAALWAADVNGCSALRRAARLPDRGALGQRERRRRRQGGGLRRQGRRRLLGVQVGGRDAPRAARPRDGVAGPNPHVDGDGRGHARGRRTSKSTSTRRTSRSTSTGRPGPGGQSVNTTDSGRPDHAPAHGDRRRDAGRDARSSRTARRRCACSVPVSTRPSASGSWPRWRRRARRRSAPASGRRRSAPTTSREPDHRPPDQAHGAPARPRARRRARRVHRGARGRGAPPPARGGVRSRLSRVREETPSVLVDRAETVLAAAAVPTPRVDAELLVGHATGLRGRSSRSSAPARQRRRPRTGRRRSSTRRAAREPLQYVLGEWGFRRLTLTVDRRASCPGRRPRSSSSGASPCSPGASGRAVLDVGTGSGAIALAIADEHPGARVIAVDASEDALELARENAARTGLELEVRRHDLFAGLPVGSMGPRRLEPAVRRSGRPEPARARGARVGAAARSSATVPPRPSRAARWTSSTWGRARARGRRRHGRERRARSSAGSAIRTSAPRPTWPVATASSRAAR